MENFCFPACASRSTIVDRSRRVSALLALIMVAAGTNAAEPLTVDEAVRMALNGNRELQVERQRIPETEADLAAAQLGMQFNPVAEAEVGRRTGPDGASADFGLEIGQEIEIGGQRKQRIAVAEARLAKAHADVTASAQLVATDVRRAFAAAVIASEGLEYAQQLSALAQKLLDSAQLRFDEGASTRLELNLAKTELGKARRDSVLAERAAATSMIDLRRLLGIEEGEPLALQMDSTVPKELPPPLEMLKDSLALRPDLAALRHEADVATAEGRLLRSLVTPNLDLGARAAQEGDEDVLGVSVGVAIPLFNRQKAEIRGAEARRRRAELAQSALSFRIEKDLLSAAERYQAAREALKIYQDEVSPLFEENLELLNEAFKTGKVNFLQVLTVQREFVEQRRLYLESLALAQEAFVDWQFAAGLALPVGAIAPVPTTESTESTERAQRTLD